MPTWSAVVLKILGDDHVWNGVTEPTPLGRLLQERRQERGYSRTRAGELAQLSPSTIESWERGTVSKPPIHDVLRLARVLEIPTPDVERSVLPGEPSAGPPTEALPAGAPLLDQAMEILDWAERDAARALDTPVKRIRALRRGKDGLSVLEVMTLTALMAAFRGATTPEAVAEELARLRRASRS